ncbi:MAG: hypothetical protein M1826_000473 [Phylliscum demangeonii]|nr:MAG: hypothetical protein M1826_000473 [Phylliscum demangeonii]
MGSHSGSLAVGELVGAASFISAVVAGSMALVAPFQVARRSFVRDVGFFAVAVVFSMIFLADGRLYLWECAVMVGSYLLYVALVLLWHWRGTKDADRLKRGAYGPVGGTGNEYLTDTRGHVSDVEQGKRKRGSTANLLDDHPVLSRAGTMPRILVENEDGTADISDEACLAQLNSNMRLTRGSIHARRSSFTPIRPSLVGALEFRAALSTAQRASQNGGQAVRDWRYLSLDPAFLGRRRHGTGSHCSEPEAFASLLRQSGRGGLTRSQSASGALIISRLDDSANRARAVSVNNAADLRLNRAATLAKEAHDDPSLCVPAMRQIEDDPTQNTGKHPQAAATLAPRGSLSAPPSASQSRALSPATTKSPAQYLTPPRERFVGPVEGPAAEPDHPVSSIKVKPDLPRLEVPWTDGNASGSARTATSPGFTASPFPMFGFLGIVSAPTVFLLTITLPVVELSDEEDESASDPAPTVADDGARPGRSACRGGSFDPLAVSSPATGDGSRRPDGAGPTIVEPDAPAPPPTTDRLESYGSIGAGRTSRSGTESSDAGRLKPWLSLTGPDGDVERPVTPPTGSGPRPREWNRWLVGIQLMAAPSFVFLVGWANSGSDDGGGDGRQLLQPLVYILCASALAVGLFLLCTDARQPPTHTLPLCFLGFIVSIAWISSVAAEVVGVLKAVGVIVGMSDAILGLTIFAVGNSLGDLVANVTVARLGYQVMALAACFGGPMLNILLGIGLGGLYMMVRDAGRWRAGHPHQPLRYRPYEIEVSKTLVISGVTLLVTLLGLLVWVPVNGWRMDRKIGWSLVALWSASTLANVVVEVAGYNRSLW